MDLVIVKRERNGIVETIAMERRFVETAPAEVPTPQEVPEEEPQPQRSWWRP